MTSTVTKASHGAKTSSKKMWEEDFAVQGTLNKAGLNSGGFNRSISSDFEVDLCALLEIRGLHNAQPTVTKRQKCDPELWSKL